LTRSAFLSHLPTHLPVVPGRAPSQMATHHLSHPSIVQFPLIALFPFWLAQLLSDFDISLPLSTIVRTHARIHLLYLVLVHLISWVLIPHSCITCVVASRLSRLVNPPGAGHDRWQVGASATGACCILHRFSLNMGDSISDYILTRVQKTSTIAARNQIEIPLSVSRQNLKQSYCRRIDRSQPVLLPLLKV
jgi:hypothetical protein